MPAEDPLRLIALDSEDLAILSAHAQDAVLKACDIQWLPKERRFVAALNRFVPGKPAGLFRRREHQRRRAALDFSRVTGMRSTGLDRNNPEQVLCLLAIRFEETNPPSGVVELVFAGEATIRLDVECLEARLADLGPAWATAHAPRHPAA
jgi:hypothetical protein